MPVGMGECLGGVFRHRLRRRLSADFLYRACRHHLKDTPARRSYGREPFVVAALAGTLRLATDLSETLSRPGSGITSPPVRTVRRTIAHCQGLASGKATAERIERGVVSGSTKEVK